jgi:hypothetical protein
MNVDIQLLLMRACSFVRRIQTDSIRVSFSFMHVKSCMCACEDGIGSLRIALVHHMIPTTDCIVRRMLSLMRLICVAMFFRTISSAMFSDKFVTPETIPEVCDTCHRPTMLLFLFRNWGRSAGIRILSNHADMSGIRFELEVQNISIMHEASLRTKELC